LREETATSAHAPKAARGLTQRIVSLGALAGLVAMTLASCGGGGEDERQDADEPSGKFPVAVNAAKFPTSQRLAETSDLRLEIENVGSETVPNLAVTIYTGDEKASGPFSVRSDQPGLADPNRPVWILEHNYPKLVTSPNETGAELDAAPSAGAAAAQTDTYAFGPLEAGASKDIIWRVTPVVAGTYTVHYELAAGLNGKAVAVADDGSSPVEGEFVVTITDKPPRASVDDSGNVVIDEN
jgi:hypothetical protein